MPFYEQRRRCRSPVHTGAVLLGGTPALLRLSLFSLSETKRAPGERVTPVSRSCDPPPTPRLLSGRRLNRGSDVFTCHRARAVDLGCVILKEVTGCATSLCPVPARSSGYVIALFSWRCVVVRHSVRESAVSPQGGMLFMIMFDLSVLFISRPYAVTSALLSRHPPGPDTHARTHTLLEGMSKCVFCVCVCVCPCGCVCC